MKTKLGLALICAGAVAVSGCGLDTSPSPEETETRTGIALTLDVGTMAGVDALRFDIETCAGEEVVTEELSLAELDFDEEMDLDLEGTTIFADYFATLEAGCYDVELVPLDEDGGVVDYCSVATAEEVEVEAGETTEIVMVSQCGGDNQGGLDVLGVLNFAPAITMIEFEPSKIVGCESVEVCTTAIDSDRDALEFEWTQLDGPTPQEGPEVVASDEDNGVHTECIEMTPGYTGSYIFEVAVYDLMEDEDGELVRVDDLVNEIDEDLQSSASLAFPVHVSCEDPPEDVLGEIEDDKKEKKDEPEDVLAEVEDEKKDKDYKPEDVLEEIEDEKKDKDYKPEDVLAEVEDEKKDKDYKPEDVLAEVEDEKKDKDYKPEDVLGEVEDEKKEKKDEPEDVLEEIEDEKKDKDYKPEDVLAELENCTRTLMFWRQYNRYADDPAFQLEWPIDEDTVLGEYTWFEIVTTDFKKKLAWGKLAQQYAVARLNIESGAEAPKTIEKALVEAEDLLAQEELRGADRMRAQDLAYLLKSFNQGEVGPGACPDVE